MEWLLEILATERFLVGGEHGGGVDRWLEIGGSRSGLTDSDSDLRWVPPWLWDKTFEKPGQGQTLTYLKPAAAGMIGVVLWSSNLAAMTLPTVDGVSAIVLLSIAAKPVVVDGSDDSGVGDGNGVAQAQSSDGSFHFSLWTTEGSLVFQIAEGICCKDVRQRRSKKKIARASDQEVCGLLIWVEDGCVCDAYFEGKAL